MARLTAGLALAGLIAAAVPEAHAGLEPAVRQLVEQGRYWDQRQQAGRAVEAWTRVLSADPDNVEALGRLAALSAEQGDRSAAQTYLNRLNAIAPNSAAGSDARAALSGRTGEARGPGDDALTRARALAGQRNYADAVEAYRQSFAGKTPEGLIALEYYQTLGATPDGWAPAREALGTLARQHPEDTRYALAYAQHLTYRENTRREGIDRLAELSRSAATGPAARTSWRQALLWLQRQPGDAPRYQRYIGVAGADPEIQKLIEGMRSADAGRAPAAAAAATASAPASGSDVREAYRLLDAGDNEGAERAINTLLAARPRDADALGALGVLRLRQMRYGEAEQALRDAQRAKPATAARWNDALKSASFWRHVQAAQAARQAGNLAVAESEYGAAFAQPPAEAPDVIRIAQADVLIERGKLGAAETIERDVLRRQPGNPDALRGLIGILAKTGRNDEALRLANGAPPQLQSELSGLRAEDLRRRATEARNGGQLPQAQALLEQALIVAPESPWVRLDLAGVYRDLGRTDQAQTLLDGLAVTNGDLPQVQLAQAYAAGSAGNWGEALQRLEALPPAQRSPDAIDYQRGAWVRYQLQRVDSFSAAHRPADAYALMDQAGAAAGSDPGLLAEVASAWARLGDTARGVGTMRRAIARSPATAAPALRVQYAGMLLAAGQDGEFEVVSDGLAARGALDLKQQRALDELVVGYRVKLADKARQAGNPGEAYVQLRDVIARYPDDPRVQMALARLLSASGDAEQSASIYRALLTRDPNNEEARLGLIDARLAASDAETARTLVDSGLRAHPADERYWRASGRVYELQGRRGQALDAYRKADELAGRAAALAQAQVPPELAWIDPSRPDYALPTAVADVLRSTAPSTGPLRPRASGVALPASTAPAFIANAPVAAPVAAPLAASAAPVASSTRLLPPLAPTTVPAAAAPAPAPASPVSAAIQRLQGYALASGLGSPAAPSRYTAAPDRSALSLRSADRLSGQPAAGTAPGSYGSYGGFNGSAAASAGSDDVARLEQETSGTVAAGLSTRSRSGQPGLGQLSDIETPLKLRTKETEYGRFGADVTPVYLDGGAATGADKQLSGTLALITGADGTPPTTPVPTNSATGVALGLTYDIGALSADIGTTPVGFLEQNLVGGARLHFEPGNWRLGLDLSRRAVTDSLLSYAGERDALTGRTWGGVVRTGGSASLGYDLGDAGLYSSLGFYTVTGHNVDTNNEFNGGAGVYVKAYSSPSINLTYGLNLTAFSYDKNLRYYTFGHGGYFSPKLFTAITVPVELQGRRGRLSYDLKGALGIQSFREDGNVYYPGFGALQQELVTLATKLDPGVNLPTGYGSQRNSGLGYSLSAAIEYRLSPRFSLGAFGGVDNSKDYSERAFTGYVRYFFEPQYNLPLQPTPLLPFYDNP